jgi:mRNA-degrading endonuclease YafQ of YafQ-DinJ toxin-antitoxin module
MEIDILPEFDKDLKQLLKKHRTLNDDLEEVKKILRKKPDERPPFVGFPFLVRIKSRQIFFI